MATDVMETSKTLPLTASMIDSIGMAFSEHNTQVIWEADRLLRVGRFGPPQSKNALTRCLRYCQLRTWSGIRSVILLAEQSGVTFVGEGDSLLMPFRTDYVNAAVYPLQFLKSLQLGAKRFMAEYDAPVGYESRLKIDNDVIRFRTFHARLPEKGKRLILSREFHVADGTDVELLYEEIVHGRVVREEIVDRGDSLELLAICDISGMYARRAGIHPIGAIVAWSSVVRGTGMPTNPRMGAVAYLPNLKLRLPFLLPDIGFNDHRDFGYPMPLMRAESFRHPSSSFPHWFETTQAGFVYRWESIGPYPLVIDERFPDL